MRYCLNQFLANRNRNLLKMSGVKQRLLYPASGPQFAIYRAFQKEIHNGNPMLLYGECYEKVHTNRRTNYPSVNTLKDG
jgi:hypothetical protein